jgi:hypothetical protein
MRSHNESSSSTWPAQVRDSIGVIKVEFNRPKRHSRECDNHGRRRLNMRFRLRTLLIVLAVGPPLLAWAWSEYRARHVTWEGALREAKSVGIHGRGLVSVPKIQKASPDEN